MWNDYRGYRGSEYTLKIGSSASSKWGRPLDAYSNGAALHGTQYYGCYVEFQKESYNIYRIA